jgi:ferredoxin-NADP reductase
MDSRTSPRRRPPNRIDALASGAARILPPLAARIDQLRLDLHALTGPPLPPARTPDQPMPAPPPLAGVDVLATLLPKALGRRVEGARRDLAMLMLGLGGGHPSPVVPRRRPEQQRPAASADAARILRVTEVERVTADAVAFWLEDPTGDAIPFAAGQFFTLLLDVEGEPLRRAYSACSDPADPRRVRLACKRIEGGRVSNHLHATLAPGQLLRVLGPSGHFTLDAGLEPSGAVVLLAGGSGITPMMALARDALTRRPDARVSLIFGNRGSADIIFAAELAAVAEASGGRFTVRHVLSDPPDGWTGGVGVLDAATVAGELAALGDLGPDALYFLCGPAAMMDAAREVLRARGVPPERIREERFASPARRPALLGAPASAQPVTVRVGNTVHLATAQPGQTVLDAGLAAGVAMPFSCAMGGCGACRVRLVAGEVDSDASSALLPAERDAGYVLACVSRPRGPVTVEVPR